jgi:hypothetical protein
MARDMGLGEVAAEFVEFIIARQELIHNKHFASHLHITRSFGPKQRGVIQNVEHFTNARDSGTRRKVEEPE